jgi:hypothetical protein
MTSNGDRPKPGNCPSWCEAIHVDGDVESEGHHGLRWSPVRADDGYWVDIATVQNKDGDVIVWVDADTGTGTDGRL